MGVIERVEWSEGSLYTEQEEEGGRLYISEIILFSEFLEEDASIRHSEGGTGEGIAAEANFQSISTNIRYFRISCFPVFGNVRSIIPTIAVHVIEVLQG